MLRSSEITYQSELIRKGIHILSLLIPIVYYHIDTILVLKILLPLTALFLLFDWLSKKVGIVQHYMFTYFGSILRHHELNDKFALNGASWVMVAACITILIFPKIIAIAALSVLVISDVSAALFGRRFGKIPFFGKTLEGSTAFVITGVLTILFIGNIAGLSINFFISGAIAVIIAAFCELFSKRFYLDDNLSIPLSIGFSLLIGNALLPFLN
jgi:dolichol kinase